MHTWRLLFALGAMGCYASSAESVPWGDPCTDLSSDTCDTMAGCGFVCDFGCVSTSRYCDDARDCDDGEYCQQVRVDPCLEVARLATQGVCVPDIPPPAGRVRCELGGADDGWACAPGAEYCCQPLDQCMAFPSEMELCPRPD